ncbi:MAG: antitoxin VbhA family protein [Sulfuricellaceae bacterium]|nr:antitoxin VbhA family protein [Sulfuricellaceae bacterium]
MKKISKLAVRKKAVTNVLASLRIEKLTPSQSVVSGLRGYLAGKTTTDELLADVMSHHVAVRRI